MRKNILFLAIFILSFIPSIVFAASTDIINDSKQMDALIPKVKATLVKEFGISIFLSLFLFLIGYMVI